MSRPVKTQKPEIIDERTEHANGKSDPIKRECTQRLCFGYSVMTILPNEGGE